MLCIPLQCNRSKDWQCMQGFREWFLGTLSLPSQGPSRAGQPVRVVLISRKPYGKKKRVARQIRNELELFAMVEQMQGVQARLIDLARISLAEQIQLVSSDTNILVGALFNCCLPIHPNVI